jgi:hypothetical protein
MGLRYWLFLKIYSELRINYLAEVTIRMKALDAVMIEAFATIPLL